MSLERTRPPHGGHGERGITVLLRRMHDVVAGEATAQERLDRLTSVIASHVVADVCSIYLRRPDDKLELYSTEGLNREAVHKTLMNWGEGLVGVVAATQKPLVTAEAPMHPAFVYKAETGEDPLHSFLGVPLIRSGKALGVLTLQNKAIRRYTDEEVEAAQAVALLLAEVAASGELLGKEETAAVGEMLHRPDRLTGVGVVAGVAKGRVAFHEAATPRHKVFAQDVAREAQRLEDGLQSLRKSVDDMLADESLAGVSRDVLEAYRLFAYDRGWKDRLRTAVFSGLTAESAVEQVKNENRARLMQARDPYLRERLHDLDDLAHRLLRHLAGNGVEHPRELPDEAVVVARMMGPADLLEYDRTKLKGLVLVEASATSHVAIVARALEIPLVAGVDDVLERVYENDEIIVDGDAGDVHVRPAQDIRDSYREKRELQSVRQAEFAKERDLPSVTKDGVEIDIHMNAGLALDMPHLHTTGARGVGLFRTELQFLIGPQLPRAEAQERLYKEVLERADGKPVVFRTADLGGDKSAAYMKRGAEGNPAMGWRGLRMAIDRPGIIRPQIRALLSASAGRELSIMFPMVTLAKELDAARALLDREVQRRKDAGRPLPTSIRVGAMIETPAAVWRMEEIASRVDFLSVGGNDLAQFYFAADRESELTQRRYDPIDPGFLSFLGLIVQKASASGTPLSYCGEQAADLLMAAALIGLGVRRFSIPATSVGPFRRMVRSIEAGAVSSWFETRVTRGGEGMRADLIAHLRQGGVELSPQK
ncbi:MAG TPA: phosphoenolpyruvate--protein phosphotransferase [Parvularculaceae bacterium]|nr:phosphoenolpyruvate--protein phosphotransferase [Caulobacterales bacterium]HPE29981.1 phosphoenolpyruvate--protein phosphotransferase [Parvularculaceae bacterium]